MYYKIMFFIILLTGTLIAISAYSWMGVWMGLEINLLSIIPLLSKDYNMMASEAALKYFITQAMTSALLLFAITMLSMNFMYKFNLLYFNLMLNSMLFTKMGAAPFHFWFPEVIEGLNWNNSLIMLTIQKIAPMILLTYNNQMLFYLTLVITSNMLISGILGLNQTSMRKIMAYSSINHMGWMIAAILYSETLWWYYFLIYCTISFNIIILFKILNIFYLKQLFTTINETFTMKFFFILNFLSLGGLPPFLGFLPKWITIQMLISNNLWIISMLMIWLTLMTLYFYMRITFTTLILNINQLNFYNTPKIPKLWIMMFNFLAITSLIYCTLMFNFL